MAERVHSSRPGTEPAAEAAAKRSAGTAPQGLLQELGPGRPLDADVRARLEPHFQDLKDVRVHTGTQAEEAADAVQARAFTVGRDVVFGAGRYQPATREGLSLLAHEATHVAQQAATGAPALQRAPTQNAPKQPAQFEGPKTKPAANLDLVKAFLATPEAQKAINAGIDQFKLRLSQAPVGEKVGAVVGIATLSAGAMAAIVAANPGIREQLHGTEVTIPWKPELKVQILTKDTPPKFDPINPPKPEMATPGGGGAILKVGGSF